MPYVVHWDNGHACGQLPGVFETGLEAGEFGDQWHREMCAMDEDPEEAGEIYEYEVVEVDE